MDNATHLGLDVHKDSVAVALLRPGQHEPDERVIPNTPEALRALVGRRRGKNLVACYEAGPTGYDTYRLLTSLGVPCDVIAPMLIPRRPGLRVKTDRLDARNLARLHRAGELTAIRVPTPEEEASDEPMMCGFDPRIREWSIVAATCPPAPRPLASPTRPP
jgi:transposase